MKKFEINDKCKLTSESLDLMGLPDYEYVIKDILNSDVPFPFVISNENLGKDWVQFVCERELIKI